MATDARPRKIAILGGGMASLAAAWELTNQADRRNDYEITVYQQGWRLGGKGASGRNPLAGDRIEEHGLHVWFGCYDNAFRMLRECYQEINRPAGAPLRSVDKAFLPQDSTPAMEYVDNQWRVWPIAYPPNARTPGTGVSATPWENIKNLIAYADQWLDEWSAQSGTVLPKPKRRVLSRVVREPPEVRPEDHHLKQCHSVAESPLADPDRPYRRGLFWLWDAYKTWRRRRVVVRRLRDFKRWADKAGPPAASPSDDKADTLRRLFIGIDLAVTVVIGFIADFVLFFGLDHLDGEDLRAWLRRHGARPETVESGPIRALYDLCFAYENGEAGTGPGGGMPNFGAGTALESALRIGLTYSGSVCYEMAAGMGDVVFAPIYQALKQRGVHFEFFHQVRRLELAKDGKSVARIHVARQVRLRSGAYEPLIDVQGLPCWPAAPDPEQIENAGALKGVDLEAPHSGSKDGGDVVLEAGKDFDRIILGIPVGALEDICGELIRRSRRWRNMVRHVKTVATQSMQLWLKRDLKDLGWPMGRVPVNAGPEPLDVWADMSHLLSRESWPAAPAGPRSLQYFCGPLPDSQASEPAVAHVRLTAESWLRDYGTKLWPQAVTGTGEFDWTILHDPANGTGAQRLDAQYLRANVYPSERYVLSVAGSAKYRLGADQSGCSNLFLAGDWTRTSYNAGCIEAAVISGLNAADAVRGIKRAGGGSLVGRALRFVGAVVARWVVLPVLRWVRG